MAHAPAAGHARETKRFAAAVCLQTATAAPTLDDDIGSRLVITRLKEILAMVLFCISSLNLTNYG